MFAAEMLMLSLIKVSLLLALSPVNFFLSLLNVLECVGIMFVVRGTHWSVHLVMVDVK